MPLNRVNGVTGTPVSTRLRTNPVSTSGFNVNANEPVEMAQEAQSIQPAGLSGILALQETETASVRDRQARRHGLAMLDMLQELQRGLLAAAGDAEVQLARLTQLAGQNLSVTDTKLADALSAIRLRAKIELLRRGGQPR